MTRVPALNEEAFTYLTTKEGRVILRWHGRQIVTVAGDQAARLIAKLAMANAEQSQKLLARATGNFKRGNERPAKSRPRG